jgi:hypothetical protein
VQCAPDEANEALAPAIEAPGMTMHVTPILMRGVEDKVRVARFCLGVPGL